LPGGTGARIDRRTWRVPPLFEWLQQEGRVPVDDMLRTFNMGIGLIVVCAAEAERRLLDLLAAHGEPGAVRIGEIRPGGEGVVYA
jgi:phosphoribosylformylglycinamidine cyclo-ligase